MRNYAPTPEAPALPNDEFALVDVDKKKYLYRLITPCGVTIGGGFIAISALGLTDALLFYGILCCAGGSLSALAFGAPQDPVLRKFVNKFRSEDNQIPEGVIAEFITNPSLSNHRSFAHTTFPLIQLATNQNYNLDQFTLALNHLFKDTAPPEDMESAEFEAAQRALAACDGAESQFLILSLLMMRLRQNENVLNQIDRAEFGQRYENFCDQKFIPYCRNRFGDTQTRFANAYVNSMRPVARGEGNFDFVGLRNQCVTLHEMHDGVPDVHLPPPQNAAQEQGASSDVTREQGGLRAARVRRLQTEINPPTPPQGMTR